MLIISIKTLDGAGGGEKSHFEPFAMYIIGKGPHVGKFVVGNNFAVLSPSASPAVINSDDLIAVRGQSAPDQYVGCRAIFPSLMSRPHHAYHEFHPIGGARRQLVLAADNGQVAFVCAAGIACLQLDDKFSFPPQRSGNDSRFCVQLQTFRQVLRGIGQCRLTGGGNEEKKRPTRRGSHDPRTMNRRQRRIVVS